MSDEMFFRYWNAVEETAVADGLLPSVAARSACGWPCRKPTKPALCSATTWPASSQRKRHRT